MQQQAILCFEKKDAGFAFLDVHCCTKVNVSCRKVSYLFSRKKVSVQPAVARFRRSCVSTFAREEAVVKAINTLIMWGTEAAPHGRNLYGYLD